LLAGGAAGELSDKSKRLIQIALTNSQRLVRLINDMLDIEKIESGKMLLDKRELVLEPLLNQAVEANAGFADKHGVLVQITPVPADAAIVADADRVQQVLTNLLSNAIKYSPKGQTVTLTTARVGARWRASVIDRGPGIPEEFRSRIFGKFAQADAAETRMSGGSGLGLSIVKELVTRLGGEVSFESTPGSGTTFHVDLPAASTAAPLDPARVAPRRLSADGRRHILHVDDDADMLRVVASVFEDQVEVHSTPSVREAEASLRRYRFDAVLLDIAMDDGCGLELLPLIGDSSPEAPVLLFTAMDVSPADAARVDLVLTKSRTDLEDLREQVSMLLERATAEGKAAA